MAGVAALRKEAILSPENSPISGSPAANKRTRRAPAAIGKPSLARVLSDVGNIPQENPVVQGDIFSPTRTSPSKAPKRQATEEESVEPIPWAYVRRYCTESAKLTYYAQQNGVKIAKKLIADTRPVRPTEAIRLARDAEVLIVAGEDGAKVQKFAPAGMTDGRLKKLIVSSRHDALRAPSYRYGATFVVGYNESVNEEVIFGEVPAEGSEKSKKTKKE